MIMLNVFVYPSGIMYLAVKLLVLIIVLLLWLNANSLPIV